MKWITIDDFMDIYFKIIQRGSSFFFSKFTLNKKARTRSAFNETAFQSSNWWIIPHVRQRWNQLITGNSNIDYRQHFVTTYLGSEKGKRLLSLGSGNCSNELDLATYSNFKEIICVDMAENRLDEARTIANEKGLNNIKFICSSIKDFNFTDASFDVVLFNASLHHFENVAQLLENQIRKCLKPGGKVVINEYVGPDRLQYPTYQIKAINESLKLIDKPYRKRYKSNRLKNKYYGSGVLRMILADPSECVDSASILPALHAHFKVLEEKPYGGNILMSTLKDISHNFIEPQDAQLKILESLFAFEDRYLEEHPSDFVFGIYEKP